MRACATSPTSPPWISPCGPRRSARRGRSTRLPDRRTSPWCVPARSWILATSSSRTRTAWWSCPGSPPPGSLAAAAAGMQELGKVLEESRPDVIVFFGSDHVESFSVTCVPTFVIIAGSHAVATFAGRTYKVPVHREMAEDLLNKLVVEANFDV